MEASQTVDGKKERNEEEEELASPGKKGKKGAKGANKKVPSPTPRKELAKAKAKGTKK